MSATESIPPQDLVAEEHVIGACLISANAIAVCCEHLSPVDFYRASHGVVFASILRLEQKGQPVDVVTVADDLSRSGELDKAGGTSRLAELAAVVPAAGNAGRYAQIVAEMALMRRLVAAGREIMRLGAERPGDARDVLDQAEQAMYDAVAHRDRTDFTPLGEVLKDQFDLMSKLMETGSAVIGVPTGFSRLDERTSGLQNGNLVVVAGRPSMGKSGWALCVANHVATKAGRPVAIFSLEMNRTEVAQRLLSLEASVSSTRLRNGRLSLEDWSRLTDAAGKLQSAPLYVDDDGATTVLEIRSKARRLKMREPNLALVIVDYLQLMASGGSTENRVQEVSQISRGLKVLARELDVPILAVSQLSRAPEQRHDKRPILSDLRESGSIEQDADVVLFLYRDEYYHQDETESAGIAELNIAKHRHGPTGVVKLAFVEKLAAFRDLATVAEREAAND